MAFQSIQLLIALVIIVVCTRADNYDLETSPDVIKPLVGGRLARVGQFPWMAVVHQLLGGRRLAMCGGTVLSARWVLTAGHCIVNFPRKYLVVFGEIDKRNIGYDYYQGPGISMITTRGALHPQYGKTINDIGLLYMPRDVRFDGVIQPIQLANSVNENQLLARGEATIVGWGKEGPTSTGSRYLKFGQIPLISNAYCSRFWNVNSGTICSRPGTGIDACEGDSGGPLVVQVNNRYIQIGIVSYGDAYCPSPRPGVFTRVSSFGWWIEQVTGIKY